MTAQAQVGIAGHQHLVVDGAVRAVTDGAAFPQRLVLEDPGTALLLVTAVAGSVMLTDQGPFGHHDILAVRAVAVVATDALLTGGVVILQAEETLHFTMALEADSGILPGIDDGLALAAAGGHMQASGAMTGFTTKHLLTIRQGDAQLGMASELEILHRIGMAQGAPLHADILGSRHHRGRHHGLLLHGRAGEQQQGNNTDETGHRQSPHLLR